MKKKSNVFFSLPYLSEYKQEDLAALPSLGWAADIKAAFN